MKAVSVEILMATYQAESWLDVQIASIFAQDYHDWRLVIRDDGSTDGTCDVIRFWRNRFPEKIVFLDEHDRVNLGVTGNFSALFAYSTAPYIFLASWDDLWYRNKVSSSVAALRALEAVHGPTAPILVHTDLRMVDANLNEISGSVLRHRGIDSPGARTIGAMCLENNAYGCTVAVNRSLVIRGTPIPRNAKVEDWWLALVAVAFGVMQLNPEVSMDWRRHGKNDSDLLSFTANLRSVAMNPVAHRREFIAKLDFNRQVIGAFLERFGAELAEPQRRSLEAFIAFPTLGFWARRRAIITHRLFFSSWLRTIGFLVLA